MILKHSAPPSSPWFIAGLISKIWTGLTSVSNSEQWNNDQQETSLAIYTHHSFWEIGVVALNESIKWLSWLVLCLHHCWSRWSWHNCKVVAPSRLEAAQIRCFFLSIWTTLHNPFFTLHTKWWDNLEKRQKLVFGQFKLLHILTSKATRSSVTEFEAQ